MIRSLLFLSLVAGAVQASAQVTPRDSIGQATLTIDQAIELARRNNPELQQIQNNRISESTNEANLGCTRHPTATR